MIEDAEVGIVSAKEAGMRVIAVPNDYTRRMSFGLADLKVTSLKEVSYNILDELIQP